MNHDSASKKAVIYLRCAASAGRNAHLAAQRKMLRRYAASQGFEVVGEYADGNCAGLSQSTCPQLRKLLEDAKAESFQHLLVRDFSRLSRGPELASIVNRLRRCEVALHCCEYLAHA